MAVGVVVVVVDSYLPGAGPRVPPALPPLPAMLDLPAIPAMLTFGSPHAIPLAANDITTLVGEGSWQW